MKRIMALLLVVVFAVSGCAAMSSFLSSGPVDFVCNPTPEQAQTAAQMLLVLDTAQAVGSAFYPAVGLFRASAILTTIKNGGCFLIAELKEAFAVVDEINTKTMEARARKLKAPPATIPQYEPLRILIK